MFCSNCGTKAIDGAVFCQKCGAKLNQENRGEREPVPVPKQESGEKSITAVRITSESEQKSVKKEGMLVEKEPMQIVSSKPIKTSTAPIGTKEVPVPEPVAISTVSNESPQIPSSESAEAPVPSVEPAMETVRDINEEELSSMPGNDADVYTLLKENTDKCPVIKSAKQFKKGVRLHGRIYRHTVRLVNVHTVQARIRSILAFPFSILYVLLAGLFCTTGVVVLQELVKYGSICVEYYHGILFSLCCLAMGAIIFIHSFVGRKEKAAVTTYIRETVEPKSIYLFDRKREGAFKVRIATVVVLVVAGIIALPFSLPGSIKYPDELLFNGFPAARLLEMTREDIEAEFGEAVSINQNGITADDYYNYSLKYYDDISHVVYSKETGKVIYIEFSGSLCSYNQKNLDKSMARVLDILDDEYWVNPMRLSSGVYGSIHSGFYYDDGVYLGDISGTYFADTGTEGYIAQQEFEDSWDYNYQFYTLRAWGEVQEDYGTSFREMREDYEIALITIDWKYRDEPNGLYSVCLYTDEWVETVNAAGIFLDQTFMNSNTDTPGGTADDSVFGEALVQLIMYNILPDGSIANDLNGKVDGMYDRFAICDIDQDGEKELLVKILSGSMSAAGMYIYGVNAARTGLEYVGSFYTDATFYDTGCVKEEWSHNQGLASNFWPYSIYQRTNDGYLEIGSVDAWEKTYMEYDFDGNPFPDEVDLDSNGIIYFISDKNGINYDNPVDDAEYKEFEKRFFGSADDLYVPWQSLELDNIRAATGIEYEGDGYGGNGVQDGTPQDSDDFWGEVGLSDFSYENLFLYSGIYEGINQTSICVNIYSSFDEGNTVGNVFLYDSSGYETFVLIRDDNEGEGIYTLCLDDFTTMYIRFYQDSYGEYYADIQGLDAIYTNVNPVETYVMTEQYIP